MNNMIPSSFVYFYFGAIILLLINGKRFVSAEPAIDGKMPDTNNGRGDSDLGVCQIYRGATCGNFLKLKSVFVPANFTLHELEERLKAAYGVIKDSKDMSPSCRVYALPSLCYSILPTCRTPELTNHQYFAARAAEEHQLLRHTTKRSRRPKSSRSGDRSGNTLTPMVPTAMKPNFSIDVPDENNSKRLKRNQPEYEDRRSASRYPPTRNTENLRRICRDECELLENELCQKEYAIAKRHPTIGQKLPLEDCFDLPHNGDCMPLGIAIDVAPDDRCYWEDGASYRGTLATTVSGKPCQKWSRFIKDIAEFPELAGQNYCRNPGHTQTMPWCYIDNSNLQSSVEKSLELCHIPRCSDQMWMYVIASFIVVAIVIVCIITAVCFRRFGKKENITTNIQNINLPNADKNIYGNSHQNSPMEMTSLLAVGSGQQHNHHHLPNHAGQHTRIGSGLQGMHNNVLGGATGMTTATNSRGCILRVPQFTLNDVKFVEELGEGAFGKVYKGELTQTNGKKIFVAVKALKENASVKTQADFKREIELISDLKHENIVCILGVVLCEEPLCMLFEYMTQGDLHEYLIINSPNEMRSLSQTQFLQIAMQICDGMEYLAGHHYVHRDLAARNCLVGNDLTVKISDFGLSRDIYSSDYYRVQSKSLLPVRWMPSESILYGKFTTESDVWSFGVVLWEIYSYGLQPYYGYSNQEVINMVRARQLLPCPESCSTAIYSLMIECWHEQAVRRPSFPEIGHRLKIWYQTQKRNDQNDGSSSQQIHFIGGNTNSYPNFNSNMNNYGLPSLSNRKGSLLSNSITVNQQRLSNSDVSSPLPLVNYPESLSVSAISITPKTSSSALCGNSSILSGADNFKLN